MGGEAREHPCQTCTCKQHQIFVFLSFVTEERGGDKGVRERDSARMITLQFHQRRPREKDRRKERGSSTIRSAVSRDTSYSSSILLLPLAFCYIKEKEKI